VLLVVCKRFFYESYRRKSKDKQFKNCKRILLITAHPDDECMFFGPTILELAGDKEKYDFHILCLSSGNFYGAGDVRKNEIKASCNILNVNRSNITIVEHTKLPDGPYRWDLNTMAHIVLKYVESLSIDTVVTFDHWGVSKHWNHRSIFYCVQNLYDRGLFPVDTQIFVLESVSLLRKYSSFFDAFYSWTFSPFIYACDQSQVLKVRSAMICYKSQSTWYRTLYMIFSRYVYLNTYRRISCRICRVDSRSMAAKTAIRRSSDCNSITSSSVLRRKFKSRTPT
uniref:N-acetylglucosaminylphosphatidylinositol deacetylase n=1 Tax=Romanomermis culicivorax TaxID=13658 RepID=A0A915LBM8_ROMCU